MNFDHERRLNAGSLLQIEPLITNNTRTPIQRKYIHVILETHDAFAMAHQLWRVDRLPDPDYLAARRTLGRDYCARACLILYPTRDFQPSSCARCSSARTVCVHGQVVATGIVYM